MQADKKILPFLVSSLLVFLLSGCLSPDGPAKIVLKPGPAEKQHNDSVGKRFRGSPPQGPTVVESAMELSKKYAELSEEAAVLREKNQDTIIENSRLKDKVAALETQLQQTQKELAEANDLLREMLIELNNWKVDILGFRTEMREADTAQLDALLKILTILGGKVKAESTQGQDANSAAISASESGRAQSRQTPTSGGSNE